MPAASKVQVWDPLIRIFHWSLAISFLVAWLSAEEWQDLHEICGYIAAGLICFRLLWGVIGSHYARFRQFLRHPYEVIRYMRDIRYGRETRYIGHNPAGGMMIFALLLTIGALTFTGWLSTTDQYWGAEWLQNLHEVIANGALVLIALHVAGVVVASLRHRENLIAAMVTGHKRGAEPDNVA